jgi:hypothetical protein
VGKVAVKNDAQGGGEPPRGDDSGIDGMMLVLMGMGLGSLLILAIWAAANVWSVQGVIWPPGRLAMLSAALVVWPIAHFTAMWLRNRQSRVEAATSIPKNDDGTYGRAP